MSDFAWVDAGLGKRVFKRVCDGDVVVDGPESRLDYTESERTNDAKILFANTLTKREQDKLEVLLGERPTDRQHLNEIMERENFRFVDKGERNHRTRKNMREWLKDSPPERRGELPEGEQKYQFFA